MTEKPQNIELENKERAPEDLGALFESERRQSAPWWKRPWIIVGIAFLLFLGWLVPFVPALYFSSIKVTRLDAKGKPIDVEVGPGTPQWINIEKVSKHVINAVIVAEDGKFYEHFGFDFEAIQKAIEVNRKKGRYARGASTISQQVIKMAFLSREKTIIRKAREAIGTVLMELLLPKNRIIEWYINLCEFGGGIYGVKAAGMHYFKTRPELLTIEQAAHLAVVIPSPNKWSKGLRARALTPFGERRFARIVKNMFLAGYITEVQKNTALARGNFGKAISGYAPGENDDEDDCRGDKECDEGAQGARSQEIPVQSGAGLPQAPNDASESSRSIDNNDDNRSSSGNSDEAPRQGQIPTEEPSPARTTDAPRAQEPSQ